MMVFSASLPGFRKISRRSWNARRYGVSLSLETPRCAESPPSRQRRVTLVGIQANVSIDVFTLAVDDLFAVECVVLLQWFVGPKAVRIDGERLLWAAGQQESNRRFICGFRRNHVPFSTPAICENKTGSLCSAVLFHVRAWSGHASTTSRRARGL